MPLASLSHYLSLDSPTAGLYTLAKWGSLAALVLAIRTWSRGFVCREERKLAGKTYLLVGGFSSTGLSVFSSLAARGAQIIALHPTPLSPSVVQLLLVLRSSSENERLYAEECDLTSVRSIRDFVLRWKKDAREGLVGDLEARLDGIVFCDGEGAGAPSSLAIGAEQAWALDTGDERLSEYRLSRLTGRHALVQLLMPILLRSAATSTSPLRLINTVSPYYSAIAPGSFRPGDLDYLAPDAPPFPRSQPWLAEGQVALASVLLWRELQRRVSTAASASAAAPSPSADAPPKLSDLPLPSTPLLALSVCPGLTRASLRAHIAPSLATPLRLIVFIACHPLIWLFAKSADEAAQGVLGALLGDVEGSSADNGSSEGKKADGEDTTGRMRVRGGALYREGIEVRIPALDSVDPSVGAELWDSETKLVERLLLAAAEQDKKGKAAAASPNGGTPASTERRKDV
ncbi:putative oxidoreductase [Rhodotorula paludigena]|uniref:putative oxidoreductase n=1 Tax=Rhodotorula paludigena TaxID=86838 RepID=UPI003175EC3E